jgi:hypothetical protein
MLYLSLLPMLYLEYIFSSIVSIVYFYFYQILNTFHKLKSARVSERMMFNTNSAIFSISWREQVNFERNDDEVRFVLDQHAELDFCSVSSLKQQSAGRHVAPLGHINLIPSLPVFALSL